LEATAFAHLEDCFRCKTDIPNTAAELRHRASPDKEGRR
jgi:hypothetical protein